MVLSFQEISNKDPFLIVPPSLYCKNNRKIVIKFRMVCEFILFFKPKYKTDKILSHGKSDIHCEGTCLVPNTLYRGRG